MYGTWADTPLPRAALPMDGLPADNMYGLTEADLETLYQAGVRTVIDLRTPANGTPAGLL